MRHNKKQQKTSEGCWIRLNLREERIEEAFSNVLKISIGHHLLIVDHRIKYDATRTVFPGSDTDRVTEHYWR